MMRVRLKIQKVLVNMQCDYEQFRDINKNGFLQMTKDPMFKWKNRIPPFL